MMTRAVVAALASILLVSCGTLPALPERATSSALQPGSDSPLVRAIQDSTPNPSMTGFRLMPIGFSSLDARVELARRAAHSLDVQYYLIANDRTGRLFMRNLRDAALRGVRVRLLVDDQGAGTVRAQRLYQLIRQSAPIADRTFEIEFLDPGVEAYAFTFG